MSNLSRVTRSLLAVAAIAAVLLPAPSSVRASEDSYWGEMGKIGEELGQKQLGELLKKVKEAQEAGEKMEKLAPDDDQYEPDYDPAGMPEVPASCKDSAQCEECFGKAYKDLNNLRFRFEKLRKVNRATKNMLRDSIAFADAMAGVAGGVAPLVWAQEKEKVRESETHFNASYDAKYQELLATLKATLQAIAACEEKVFGEQGWYERYGFMYYQFMAATYRRPD